MTYRIVHYINQFFAGIGGEEKADFRPESREGAVGPGIAFKAVFPPFLSQSTPKKRQV